MNWYELVNHLGNVLATVSDKAVLEGDHYVAEVMSAGDYYPFGMGMGDRKWSLGWYRYGFNGKENDNEVKGEGNEQDYGMRVYDPRLGRFLSVDPLSKDYPHYTPYSYAGNKPIESIDLDGEEELHFTLKFNSKIGKPELILTSVKLEYSLGLFSVSYQKLFGTVYIVDYPQGPFGSRSYKFSEHSYITQGVNTIDKFNHWLNNPTAYKFKNGDLMGLEHLFMSGAGLALNTINTGLKAYAEYQGASLLNTRVVRPIQVQTNATAEETATPASPNSVRTSTLEVGPYARRSIPARGPARNFTQAERDAINQIGETDGCHTCGATNPGTKSGNFLPDHQPANQLNPSGGPQQLYPHCINCSRVQGGEVRQATRAVPGHSPPPIDQSLPGNQ